MFNIKDEQPFRAILNECREKLEQISQQGDKDKPDLGMYIGLFSRTIEIGKLYRIDVKEYEGWWEEYKSR